MRARVQRNSSATAPTLASDTPSSRWSVELPTRPGASRGATQEHRRVADQRAEKDAQYARQWTPTRGFAGKLDRLPHTCVELEPTNPLDQWRRTPTPTHQQPGA